MIACTQQCIAASVGLKLLLQLQLNISHGKGLNLFQETFDKFHHLIPKRHPSKWILEKDTENAEKRNGQGNQFNARVLMKAENSDKDSITWSQIRDQVYGESPLFFDNNR